MWNIVKRFANLGKPFYEYVAPTPLTKNVRTLHINGELLDKLELSQISNQELLDICSGNQGLANYDSLASCYMGHQFGVPVARLGDGRAILIGEQLLGSGEIYELQLKGAGPTPFSRRGDGRAVLRSSIREYLLSQAMKQLGIPTTEALAIVTSNDSVIRETKEDAAIVLRTAESFIRFGHFEYYALHNKIDELEHLIRFVVQTYYPLPGVNDIALLTKHLLQEVVIKTAQMIAKWQSVGFVHGVMNTDNMSILGLTIDYGPFAFMDEFAPKRIYNHSDSDGRYTYANQPQIGWWNLYRLAEALIRVGEINEVELQNILDSYAKYYNEEYQRLMWQKVGVKDSAEVSDVDLVDDVLSFLEANAIDYTLFWHKLSIGESGLADLKKLYSGSNFDDLFIRISTEQLHHVNDKEAIYPEMQLVNPVFILRNHLLHEAVEKAKNNSLTEFNLLYDLISKPYQKLSDLAYYYQIPPVWASNLVLSCSS